MFKTLPLFLAFTGAAVFAEEPVWFTVMGNASDPSVDSVELNVARLPPRGEISTMDLRVTLAVQRTMPDGEKYTSYHSQIAIDCDQEAVVHVEQVRYEGPQWTGAPTAQHFHEMRPMAFGGLAPNPKDRVLKAACRHTP